MTIEEFRQTWNIDIVDRFGVLGDFVKLVRERAEKLDVPGGPPVIAVISQAFNEIVRELGLEEK